MPRENTVEKITKNAHLVYKDFNEPGMKFKEFEPRFKLSAGLNLETFDTILSGTNHIKTAS